MTWTAEVLSVSQAASKININIQFSDGAALVQETFSVQGGDLTYVKREVRRRIAQLEANDALIPLIPIGPLDVTPLPDDPPDQTVIDFRADVRNLQRILEMERLGVAVANMATKKATLQSNINAALVADQTLANQIS